MFGQPRDLWQLAGQSHIRYEHSAYIQVGDRLCDSKKNGRRSSVLKWGRAVYGGVEHRKHWEQCKGERDVFARIK